jgi:hypothetical protein
MFGSVDIKVRPIKLAYLIDPNNAKQTREAIRLSSTLWGGTYFPIIPLHKRMPASWRESPVPAPPARKVILAYLDAFDPDILVQLSKEIPTFLPETGLRVIKPEDVWQLLNAETGLSPQFGIGIFELLNDVFDEYFKYKVKYPVRVVIPKIPRQLSLFWASLFGEIPSEIFSLLEKHYFEPLEIQATDFQANKLDEIIKGDVLFPRRVTDRGLNHFSRSSPLRNASVYFMDATKTEDIVDFWNLRALGKPVIPIPKQLKEDLQLRALVVGFLKSHRRPWRHDPKVCDHANIIRSRNSTMEELGEYAKTLRIDREPNDPSSDPFFALQHWYPRIWDEWARYNDGAVPEDIYGEKEHSLEVVDANELHIRFKALLPEFALEFSHHGSPRCANEITFRFYGLQEHLAEVFPKPSGDNFARAISGFASYREDWRVGRNGLVKLVEHDFNESRNIPAAENIMFSWLTDLGWKPQLSTAGLLAKQIYRQLGGEPLHILTNESLLGLLEHMNGGLVNKDGSPVDDDDNKIGQERQLPVGQVKSTLGGLYGYALAKNMFKLGLRMKCPHCVRHSWFSLENLRDSFTCPKCINDFPALGNLEGKGATWCYKTTGPFSVPKYADGAYAILLTLEFFDDRKLTTMRTTPVFSFEAEAPNKKKIEADFALFWQQSLYGEKKDGLVFGECKTYGRFKEKDFERMRYLAKTFPGAVLVFSTLRKTLTAEEITGITRIAKTGRRYWKPERPINPVLVLTGTELLDWQGPPYCWEKLTDKKLNRVRVRGLLGVCDATQQIYLSLPPWESEWHEKWERIGRRRASRAATKKSDLTLQ